MALFQNEQIKSGASGPVRLGRWTGHYQWEMDEVVAKAIEELGWISD
jgi:hypothetical protein